jgi:CRISPR system Cascade subunit CasA
VTKPNYDILKEQLIPVRLSGGRVASFSLPEVLAALSSARDEVEGFPGLRHHQQHPWFAFLVQLAAMAVHWAGESHPPEDSETWRKMVLELAENTPEAFYLIVDDPSKPAFFQPPAPEGKLEKFKSAATTPDALDIIPTGRNHDVKGERAWNPEPHYWLYSILTLQTMQGFYGQGNYGIVRMNGGFGNRPCVTFAPSLRWSSRFIRDVGILLAKRESLISDFGYKASGGHHLLWLLPWDGAKDSSLTLQECDPYFLEVCRRIRLIHGEEGIEALSRPTKAPRTEASELNGDVGDPWTPIDRSGPKALTVAGDGFTYRKTHQFLTYSDYRPGMAGEIQPDDRVFLAKALVRGQGKTEGFHERVVRIPETVRSLLFTTKGRDQIAEMAEARVEQAQTASRRILHPALCTLLQGAPDKLNLRDDSTQPWLSSFDEMVDRSFFDHLFADIDKDETSARVGWQRTLIVFALKQLEDAIRAAPDAGAREYRAVATAERVFYGTARKHFADLYSSQGEKRNEQTQ